MKYKLALKVVIILIQIDLLWCTSILNKWLHKIYVLVNKIISKRIQNIHGFISLLKK